MRRVPWISFQEWCEVREWLLSRDAAQVRLANKRIGAWRNRGKVPISIETTSSILQLLHSLQQQQHSSSSSTSEKETIRYAMAMTIIRLVNGLTNAFQKGIYASSLSIIASQIGLPRFIIDIRHSATHGKFPPLNELSNACEFLLFWLEQMYWNRQSLSLSPEIAKQTLKLSLSEYRSSIRTNQPLSTTKQLLKKTIILINSSSQSILSDYFIPILLDFLVPHTENPKVFDCIPEALKNLWSPALEKFIKEWNFFILSFSMIIARRIVSLAAKSEPSNLKERKQNEYQQSLLSCWFNYICIEFSEFITSDRSSLLSLIECVMGSCYPPKSKWTDSIASNLIGILTDTELAEKLKKLRVIASNAGNQIGRLLSKPLIEQQEARIQLTPDEIELKLEQMKEKSSERRGSNNQVKIDFTKPWSEIQLKVCPIGLLPPNGEIPELNLPEELDEMKFGCFLKYAHDEIEFEEEIHAIESVSEEQIQQNNESEEEEENIGQIQTIEEQIESNQEEKQGNEEEIPETKRQKTQDDEIASRFAALL